MRPIPLLLGIALLLPAPARAQLEGRDRASVEAVQGLEAYAAYKMGRYDIARTRWEALVEAGNTTAMINLANMYQQGQGVARDPARARALVTRAADLGDARAQYELGLAHEQGDGVPRNLAVAAGWLERAARQGKADAQFALGVLLATAPAAEVPGAGREAGLHWLRQAADAGHAEAALMLTALHP